MFRRHGFIAALLFVVVSLLPLLSLASDTVLAAHLIDEANDEYGTYPTDVSLFPPNQQRLFDLLELQVLAADEEENSSTTTTYRLKLANLWNPQTAPFGWTHPLIQVYVFSEPSGSWRVPKSTEQQQPLVGNPSLLLDERYRWSHLVRCESDLDVSDLECQAS